jgi:23S rRNA G2445 N2-methylase RlmL
MEGDYPFPRQHLRDKVERDIAPVLGHRFRQVDRRAGLEIWVTAGLDVLSLDVRISSDELRHRGYKQAHLPGSLRPAVAAACVRYARPQDGDTFCDPFCGTGTIGIERALCGVRYSALLVGDRDPRAVDAAATNFGPRHQPRLLARWDARRLPLADESVDIVVTNPPFGGKIATADPGALYAAALAEIVRVLRPDGRLVIIAEDRELLVREAKGQARLSPGGRLRVELQGREATVLRYFRGG